MHIEIDQHHLHAAVRNLLHLTNSITLLQIGANDGLDYDPVRDLLVTEEGIIGFLVEPQKEAFSRLQANYEQLTSVGRVTLIDKAVYHKNGKVKLYKNTVGNDGHSSLLLRQNDNSTQFYEDVYEEVEAVTFESLLNIINGRIDVLVMDTEGYDCTIIKQMLQSQCRPSLLFFERPNPVANNDRLNKVATGNAVLDDVLRDLDNAGYSAEVLTGNIIAFKN